MARGSQGDAAACRFEAIEQRQERREKEERGWVALPQAALELRRRGVRAVDARRDVSIAQHDAHHGPHSRSKAVVGEGAEEPAVIDSVRCLLKIEG